MSKVNQNDDYDENAHILSDVSQVLETQMKVSNKQQLYAICLSLEQAIRII